MPLNKQAKVHLRSLGRRLDARARVGKEAVSEALLAEMEQLLEKQELVKVRFVAHKEERRELSKELAERLQAELVDLVGHVAVFYRASKQPREGSISLQLPGSRPDAADSTD